MKICFVHTPMSHIYTPGRDNFWKNFDYRYMLTHPNAKTMKKYTWEIPHWIPWLAGVLAKSGFDDLLALDLYTDCGISGGINETLIIDLIKQHTADVYLFSPLTPNLGIALRIADFIKEIFPESQVIFGGVVVSPIKEYVIAHRSVDYVIYDRGEIALVALLQAIEKKTPLKDVGNLVYKNKGIPIVNAKLEYLSPNEIPFPKVDIFSSEVGENIRYIRLEYTRGCPSDCAYCSIPVNNHKPEYFSVKRVLDEIDAYKKQFGTHHHIYFGDPTFTINYQKTKELCLALAEKGDVEFDCQTRLDRLSEEILNLLVRSGCRWLEIGIESSILETRHLYKKYSKVYTNLFIEDLLLKSRDKGIPVCFDMLLGLPNETLDQMKISIDWVSDLIDKGLLQASYVFNLVPYPGTKMYSLPEQYGIKIRHQNLDLYREDLLPVYDTRYATAEQIYDVLLYGIQHISSSLNSKSYFEQSNEISKGQLGGFWDSAHP